MRELLRTHDWDNSSLGPPSDWPVSLRNIVNLIVDSKFPMFVIWGEGLGTIYNDAYAPLLGCKHPDAIGLGFDHIWPEIWRQVEPLVATALSGEASFRENLPLILQRRGYPEPGWFTFSYSPLRDDLGHIGGIYCAIVETTDAVMAGKNNRFTLELADCLRGAGDAGEITRLVARMLGEYLHASDIAFAEFDAERSTLHFHHAFAAGSAVPLYGMHAPSDLGPPAEASLRSGELQTGADVLLPNRLAPDRSSSVMLMPMRENGQVSGIMLVADASPRHWHASELALVREVAWRTGVKTDQARAEAELRTAREFSLEILSSLTEGVVLIGRDFRVMYINPEGLKLEGRAASEIVGKKLWQAWPSPDDLEVGELLKKAILERKPFNLEHLYHFASGYVAWLETRAFPAPQGIVVLYRDITERKRVQENLRQAALHDPLTDLPNRALLFEHAIHVFANARRNHHHVAVLFIDLDRFKPINDQHGHEAGDEVLRQVAQRLRETVRQADVACRLGGDEFLVLLNNLRGLDSVTEVARHICEALHEPYQFGELSLSLSASIGISVFPRDGCDMDTLISRADAAMYQAKQTDPGSYQFYSADLARRSIVISSIEQQIQTALQQEQFLLHYQPVINIVTGAVISVEALLRWQHEEIGPDRFVPIAEVSGQIIRIGDWVIAQACRQSNQWRTHGMPAIPIAINVSAVQFRSRDFADHFAQILGQFKVHPSAVQLELTETALMENIDYTIDALRRFQSMGVTIALDDFGTGYSSLTYLSRLPIDKIKVDKSFVQGIEKDMPSRAITEAVIALGRTLHLDIVAEGIESEDALGYLRAHGCDQAQGFHVCRPVDADAFESWCRLRSAATAQARASQPRVPG